MNRTHAVFALFVALICAPFPAAAQAPVEGEVRQLVTFTFLPGQSGPALAIYADEAIPLYEDDGDMLTFRAFREVESPTPLDLVIVRAFNGMAGMDASNTGLAGVAERAGTSVGAIYGRIGALSSGHTDQFVEMLPALGSGDPTSRRLTAFVWYRVEPGRAAAFENTVAERFAPFEEARGVHSSTGRFLLSDGWDYLRFLGFDSLEEYQAYWSALRDTPFGASVDALTLERREAVLSSLRNMEIR